METSQDAASLASPPANSTGELSRQRPDERIHRVPAATYRLQLRSDFGLDDVCALLPYLKQLGISDVYLSPLFRAREESSHGYDVVDHGAIERSFGGLSAFQRLAEAVRDADMGLLLDIVPNHMGINDPGNVWWSDVLENGEASPYAEFFDIDWQPAGTNVQHQVLLPFLGAPFGQALESGDLKIAYVDGQFQVVYWSRRFPLSLPSVTFVLDLVGERLRNDSEEASAADNAEIEIELQEIITQLRHLTPPSPGKPDANKRRRVEQQTALERFGALVSRHTAVQRALVGGLAQLNGELGNSRSFDQLEQLLDQQWYRLAYWRVATDEINYRRFFDINDLAAIRVEDPRVFEAVHRLVALCLAEDWVTGLRIDHPDGLLDPQAYFEDLQRLYRSVQRPGEASADRQIYIVAEKILGVNEELPQDWAVCGTTGYDLMNMLSRVLVDAGGLRRIREAYRHLTNEDDAPDDILYESKRAILTQSMASELQVLSAQLYRIAQQHRSSRDFTRPVLQRALREVLASLAVYRTYLRPTGWDVNDVDYRRVTSAVRLAKRRNRIVDFSAFDFIASVLLLENPPALTPEQAADRRRFALKFQQVSGPVAAKGVEDTAFYRHYPLAALNEVGGELAAEPLTIEAFHRLMRRRADQWPHSMSATATHDTKRGEDCRARLLVLSEISELWCETCERWQKMNRPLRQEVDGDQAPSANEEYLLYQTLVGTWPLAEMSDAERNDYAERIVQYMEKALREAKQHSSWLNPSQEYEEAVFAFIWSLFSAESAGFRAEMTKLVEQIASAGFVNALSQLALKITLPGVPDFYQGTELWDFNLVDPDNRRPVDFGRRRMLLERLLSETNGDLTKYALRLRERWPDPETKLFIALRGLHLRRRWPNVFTYGEYIPVTATGGLAEQVIAFVRRVGGRSVIVIVARQSHGRFGESSRGVQSEARADWADTFLLLPAETNWAKQWTCELSGQTVALETSGDRVKIKLADALRVWQVAILTAVNG